MGTGACGASESLANCAWAKGIYEHQGCHDSAPGSLSISVNVGGESVNDCARLAHMCNSSVEWVEDFRSDCPVTCGACGEETQKEAEGADATSKADATRNATEVSLARTVADLSLEPQPDDTVAQLL